ncbi:histidinol-phosphatase [Thalassococcus sp. S3]|uniref:histidinol-phosphatase n=1 Tax=Thalassococcus sp. S3 TaxID=2017482 RepID=UPI00102466CA|nr:histidinol-phosphatase [Thalassococcus sp. S3]QBF32902.1 histidinol-phosphatase [Thalassococcus sp. S3]
MTDDATSDMDIAGRLADEARTAILPFFRQNGLATENKASNGFDPVTQADRAAEAAMRDVLRHDRPLDGIWGEEFGQLDGESGRTWVLDPIDGTRSFISGTPTWGVLIALSDEDGPRLGVIDQPYIGERFCGARGEAWLERAGDRAKLATRATTKLSDAILFTTFPEVGSSPEKAAFDAVRGKVKLTRYGMDCYAYALLAAGQIDLVIEAGLQAYDIQAPIAVIEAAGGCVTNWSGGSAHLGGRVVAAANADLHQAVLDILKTYDQT